jgi:hypothetical protein
MYTSQCHKTAERTLACLLKYVSLKMDGKHTVVSAVLLSRLAGIC